MVQTPLSDRLLYLLLGLPSQQLLLNLYFGFYHHPSSSSSSLLPNPLISIVTIWQGFVTITLSQGTIFTIKAS